MFLFLTRLSLAGFAASSLVSAQVCESLYRHGWESPTRSYREIMGDVDPVLRDSRRTPPSATTVEATISAALREIESRLSSNERELRQEEDFRRNKDPRWWGTRWFQDLIGKRNPVDLQLESDIRKDQRLKDHLEVARTLVNELEELRTMLERIGGLEGRDGEIYRWLRAQVLIAIHEIGEAARGNDRLPEGSIADMRHLDEKLDEFVEYLRSPRGSSVSNPLITDYARDRKARRVDALKDLVSKRLEREVDDVVMLAMLGAARTSKKSLEETVDMFKAIDLEGVRVFPEGNREMSEGIHDNHVIILTRIALQNSQTAKKIVKAYKEIHEGTAEIGRNGVPMMEVAVLVSAVFEFGATAKQVVKRYTEIEALGHDVLNEFYLESAAVTYLVRTSLKHHKSKFDHAAKEEMQKELREIYDLGESSVEDFYINDLGLALIHGIKWDFSLNSCREVTDQFFEIYRTFESRENLPTLTDENLARSTRFCFFHGVKAEWLANHLERIHGLAGEPVSYTRGMTVLGFALQETKGLDRSQTSPESLTSEMLELGLMLPYFGRATAYDFLIDQANIIRPRPTIEVGRTYERPSYRREDRFDETGYERSGFESKKDEDDWGLGFSMDTDGFKPTMGIGSGMSIDLTDGSLKIGLGGGFSMDTDGDGFGFKF